MGPYKKGKERRWAEKRDRFITLFPWIKNGNLMHVSFQRKKKDGNLMHCNIFSFLWKSGVPISLLFSFHRFLSILEGMEI